MRYILSTLLDKRTTIPFASLGAITNQSIYDGGNFGDVPPSILHEYPIAAGFPNVIISSGVAILGLRKPVSSNRPMCCFFLPVEKRGGGRSTVRGDTMLRRLLLLLLLLCVLSMADDEDEDDDDDDDVVLWPWPSQDGVTMLSRSVSAVESWRPIKVWVGGDTRLISTVSAEDILRSVQRGGEVVLGLARLALLSWQLSISVIFGVGVEKSRLLVEASLGRRIQLFCESPGRARVLLL